jgi:hypothetical protein
MSSDIDDAVRQWLAKAEMDCGMSHLSHFLNFTSGHANYISAVKMFFYKDLRIERNLASDVPGGK